MSREANFWRNVALIGLLHVALLAGLIRWSRTADKPARSDILWIEGGTPADKASAPGPAVAPSVAAPIPEETPVADPSDKEELPPPADHGDIPLPTPSVTVTPSSAPTPKLTPTPSPSAR